MEFSDDTAAKEKHSDNLYTNDIFRVFWILPADISIFFKSFFNSLDVSGNAIFGDFLALYLEFVPTAKV